MSCEKYSGWMTDAALGELRGKREPELLAHAMECEACREALSHATKVREFVERGIEALVEEEPSPQFATRLRRRIA
jgi:anti-sigma factor RsiW